MKKAIFFLFILVSTVSISAQYQLFNKDFEEWVEMPTSAGNVTYLTPYGDIWATSNEAAMVFVANPSVNRTTDKYNGTYAAKIETIQLGTSKGSGTLFTGKFKLDIINPLNSTIFGIPFTDKPVYLKGFYKYSPVDGDSCRIASYLTKWNTVNKRRDTIALATINRSESITAVTSFKEFDIFYNYYISDKAPDSLTIVFASSADGANFNAAVGSTLIIDAISLEYHPLAVDKIEKQNEIISYPNPVGDVLTIMSKTNLLGLNIKIYNTLGSLVLIKQLRADKEQIFTSGLPSGVYHYTINRENKILETGKLLKK